MRAPFRMVAPMPISAVVFNGAAVQHHRMSHGDAIADGEREAFVQMQRAVVLNAGFVADAMGRCRRAATHWARCWSARRW